MTLNLTLKQSAFAIVYAAILPVTLYFEQNNTSYLLIVAIFVTLPFVPLGLLAGSYVSVKVFGSMEYIYYIQYVAILIQTVLVLNLYNLKKVEVKKYFQSTGI